MSGEPIALGVDIGGSKTHAVASRSGEVVLDHTTGSANLQSVAPELVGQRLTEIFDLLDAQEVRSVHVGAAGADGARAIGLLESMLRERAPLAAVTVVHDTELLLPAAGRETGIALLSGTGSVALGVAADGSTARAGGWGYLLGDEGSGFWVFREAVRHALRANDLGAPRDELCSQLLRLCGCADAAELLEHSYAHQERRIWAKQAGIVLGLAERGEPAASGILARAADELAALAEAVRGKLGGELEVVLAGGLLTNTNSLQRQVRERLLASGFAAVSVLDKPPAFGALALAERKL